jgi:signal transduction histidine kinase
MLSLSISLLCCKYKGEQSEKDRLNPKFRTVDSLLYVDKQQDIGKILDTVRTTMKMDDVENLTYYYYYRGLISSNNVILSAYADSALNLFETEETQKKYSHAYIKSLLLKGLVYKYIKRYHEALDCYLKIKALADEIAKDKNNIYNDDEYAEYVQNIADIYFRQHNYEMAAKYYTQAYQVYETASSPDVRTVFFNKQAALNNSGYAYEKAKLFNEAELIYKKGLAMLEKEQKKGVVGSIQIGQSKIVFLDNLGGLLERKGQLNEAKTLLERAIAVKDSNHERSKAPVYIKLASVYTKLKAYNKATIAFENAAKLISEYPIENGYLEPRLEKVKSDFFLAQKNYKASNKHLLLSVKVADSLRNQEDANPDLDLNSKFEIIKVKGDVKSLEKTTKRKTIYLVFAGIFIVMLVAIILLAQKTARQAKKAEKQAEQHNIELQKIIKKLEEKNKDYAKMMKIMAHDLKNPVSGMVVIANLLLSEDHFNEEEREMLELIVTSGENMVEMIDQLLKSGLAIENEVLTKEKVDIRQLLRQCTELLNYKANDKHQRLSFISHGNAEIMASKEKIWRVFNNLIVNSIKFSPEYTHIKVVLEKLGSSVRISVSDQGIGIAEKDREKIFDMFTEAKRPGTAGEQPFGIGLSISKQIIESHNGKIWLNDNPGGGTVFYVELPI